MSMCSRFAKNVIPDFADLPGLFWSDVFLRLDKDSFAALSETCKQVCEVGRDPSTWNSSVRLGKASVRSKRVFLGAAARDRKIIDDDALSETLRRLEWSVHHAVFMKTLQTRSLKWVRDDVRERIRASLRFTSCKRPTSSLGKSVASLLIKIVYSFVSTPGKMVNVELVSPAYDRSFAKNMTLSITNDSECLHRIEIKLLVQPTIQQLEQFCCALDPSVMSPFIPELEASWGVRDLQPLFLMMVLFCVSNGACGEDIGFDDEMFKAGDIDQPVVCGHPGIRFGNEYERLGGELSDWKEEHRQVAMDYLRVSKEVGFAELDMALTTLDEMYELLMSMHLKVVGRTMVLNILKSLTFGRPQETRPVSESDQGGSDLGIVRVRNRKVSFRFRDHSEMHVTSTYRTSSCWSSFIESLDTEVVCCDWGEKRRFSFHFVKGGVLTLDPGMLDLEKLTALFKWWRGRGSVGTSTKGTSSITKSFMLALLLLSTVGNYESIHRILKDAKKAMDGVE
ncbi:hypothetical protein BSKO_11970 [Bryopsis sp. KO-2023]|nr:hypothetical protein BSKO_11970 [Bryopsis sp. KO-2023]